MEQVKNLLELYKSLGNLKYDFRNYNLNKLILSKIKGKSIIDIGCGSGFLLSKIKAKKAIGIEPDEEMIKLAKKLNPDINIIKGRAEDIDFLVRKKVDNISIIDVLEHVKEDRLLIKKIYDKLNFKGKLIIVMPAFQFLYGIRDRNNRHFRRYSKKNLVKILENAGFKIKEIRYWNFLGFFPYFFYEKILRKPLYPELRTEKPKKAIKIMINRLLNLWFDKIEKNFDFGFGLSLICVAER